MRLQTYLFIRYSFIFVVVGSSYDKLHGDKRIKRKSRDDSEVSK